MTELHVRLLGRLTTERGGAAVEGIGGGKAQELFGYLLVRRDRPHSREQLAAVLWGETTTAQSKKYLRQVLWQLQVALRAVSTAPALRVDAETVQFRSTPGVWVDLAVFDAALASARGVSAERLDAEAARALDAAVELYRGDLLEGWYQEWCRDERDRVQADYLAALDKLLAHSEARGDHEAGLRYGALSLRVDPARETSHQRLMRLQYAAGDRAGALRQYERCRAALARELDVEPAPCTVALYEQIRAGRALAAPAAPAAAPPSAQLQGVLTRLRQLDECLADVQRRVQTEIAAVEHALRRESNAQQIGLPPRTASDGTRRAAIRR